MKVFFNIIKRSLGKKYIMAVTGLYLSLFLVIHLIGNLFLLVPDDGVSFLTYAETLGNSLFIKVNKVILIISILVHFITALVLSIQNKQARGSVKYATEKGSANSRFVSRYMTLSALLVLGFLVLHLSSFAIPQTLGLTEENLYDMVVDKFSNLYYVIIYVVSIIFLSLHLSHGFNSIFQSLGVNTSLYVDVLKVVSFSLLTSYLLVLLL